MSAFVNLNQLFNKFKLLSDDPAIEADYGKISGCSQLLLKFSSVW